ncbi:MAG: hypothetical protein JWL64_2722 [Frankiales bacterium]|nr:hypothetical protein [Frankiales bacterium]
MIAAVRQLEAELAELAADRDAQLRQSAERHAAERAAWQTERVQLLQQLVQEAAAQAALSTALDAVRRAETALKDELAAAVLAREAAVRRQLHDAARHVSQLSEAQEAARASSSRGDELRAECLALRRALDELVADSAGTLMTSALVVDQLHAEIETLQGAARPAPAEVPPDPARREYVPVPASVAVDVLPVLDPVRRGVLTGLRRR